MIAKAPLTLDPQPEGGYTVTSPLLRGLVTEGDTIAEALFNAQDAFQAVLEAYKDLAIRCRWMCSLTIRRTSPCRNPGSTSH